MGLVQIAQAARPETSGSQAAVCQRGDVRKSGYTHRSTQHYHIRMVVVNYVQRKMAVQVTRPWRGPSSVL